MANLRVELVAVEERFWSGEAALVTAQTTEGEIGLMAGHEPVLGELSPEGVVVIKLEDGTRKVASVQGGFLSVTAGKVTVLAEAARWADDVDASSVQAELDAAEAGSADALAARSQLRAVERAKQVS